MAQQSIQDLLVGSPSTSCKLKSKTLVSLEVFQKYVHNLGNELRETRKAIYRRDLAWIQEEIHKEIYENRIDKKLKEKIEQMSESEIEDARETLDEILTGIISEISTVEVVYKNAQVRSDDDALNA